jgi:hypothetical protein
VAGCKLLGQDGEKVPVSYPNGTQFVPNFADSKWQESFIGIIDGWKISFVYQYFGIIWINQSGTENSFNYT